MSYQNKQSNEASDPLVDNYHHEDIEDDWSNTRHNAGFRQNFIDCSNVFKGFISAAFVGLPFGVLQAGVGFAIILLLIIAIATDHCCAMIVKCKDIIINEKLKKLRKKGVSEEGVKDEALILGKTLSFGQMGKICLGRSGVLAVNISVIITQLGFTIGYFIYMGNTMRTVLKYFFVHTVQTNITNTTIITTNTPLTTKIFTTTLNTTTTNYFNLFNDVSNTSIVETLSNNYVTSISGGPFSQASLISNSSLTFAIFLIIIAPILILISFVRDLRKLGPVSVIANVSIIVAFTATVSYILAKMKGVPTPLYWFRLTTFPIYFGQVTAAFEGIGTVIPIEASMAENRHRYPRFLHITVVFLTMIFGSFGIVGYLAYGEKTCQILTANLTGGIAIVLQCLIFVGVLFTYPLQIYPCIQITESVVISIRKWRATRKCKQMINTEKQTLKDGMVDSYNSISDDIPPEVTTTVKLKTWEGNIIRGILVIITAMIALKFRSEFAYIAALTGSIGSSLLSYILPPLFHMSLEGRKMKRWVKVKNVILIIFGVILGVMGLTVTIQGLVESFKKGHQSHC